MDTSPGYPRPNPSPLPFWLQHTRNSPILGHRTRTRSQTRLTSRSSARGSLEQATAYFLLTAGPEDRRPRSVTLLEAREACDGATARNGGHCRPDCYRDYPDYKADFGQEQALKIIQNEMDTLNLVEEIIAKEGIDCDFWRGFTYDIAMDQPAADSLAASYAEFAADGGPSKDIVTPILDPTQARETTWCQAALAAYKCPAGALFPRKLVLHLLGLCVEKYGMNLQTRTPRRGGAWRRNRGAVETETVVYATNAYTATLLPEFVRHIWPFKGQCAAVVPPEAYAGPNMFRETYRLAPGDYLIQQPTDGVIIFGGQQRSVPVERLLALKKALPHYFAGWGEDSGLAVGEGWCMPGLDLIAGSQASWDIPRKARFIAATISETETLTRFIVGIPYVGELHDKPGAFICAGHHGHGMARVMTRTRGLATLIQGGSCESTGLPECFQPTRERLARPKQVATHNIGKQEVIAEA
ncbi:FAD dependent oxidoreductase-domain-containing protein [Mycena olivaceomarginata]|nr:FAD dependent oxidoreductase-domain-containing protein [Mycena olivaceomarginata]